MSAGDWPQQLSCGLQQMQLTVDARAQQSMLDYLALLQKWNKAFNLTAIRDPGEMVARQLLDSLAVLPFLYGSRVLDVGTGAGLPGIPLALAQPQRQFVLLDSNSKKTRFLNQVLLELNIGNVQVICGRVEAFHPEQPFHNIVSRAFASLDDMLRLSRHLLAADGRWLAMKGQLPEAEIRRIPSAYRIELHPLYVAGLHGQRHLVVVFPQAAMP